MKKTNSNFLVLFAAVTIAVAVTSINCAGPGTMYGSVGVNIGDQPIWGPEGYDHADFYYIPDIDCYYSVSERQYIYRNGAAWEHGYSLPPRYNGYDPYHSYKVVVNEDKPYQNHDSHQAKYGAFKGVKNQPVIRDSKDPKYYINKDHPQHDTWVKQQKQ